MISVRLVCSRLRGILACFWLFCAAAPSAETALQASASEAPARPNILLILLDDFGLNNLSTTNNNPVLPTPTLDQFASHGIRFTRHYTDAVCAPSRAALLTGRLPPSIGFHTYRAGLSPQLQTLPEQLQKAGYRTHMVGKWHLGHAYPSARPEQQGFRTWFGLLEATDTVAGQDPGELKKISYIDPWIENEKGDRVQHKGHLTDLLAANAIHFIEQNRQPWFMYLSFLAPHRPIMPSAAFAEKYPKDPEGRYLALLEQLDQAIFGVFESLKTSGNWDNTIIVVASDNGGTTRSFPDNLPYAGKKGEFSEGGVRTPLIVYWQGRWEGGETLDHAVALIDIAPTLLESASVIPDSGMEGRNLFTTEAPRPLFWYHEMLGIRQRGMLSADGDVRLFKVADNPGQLLTEEGFYTGEPNVYDLQPQRVRALEVKYEEWLQQSTEVELIGKRSGEHRWLFTGDDYRRSPVLSSYTLGASLVRDGGTLEAGPLLKQAGYFDIRQTAAGELALQFDGYRKKLPIQTGTNKCHSLIVTAFMVKSRGRTTYRKGSSEISVYWDGKLLHEASYQNREYSKHSPDKPLIAFSNPAQTMLVAPGVAPVISTRRLTADEVATRLHPKLLQACSAQTL